MRPVSVLMVAASLTLALQVNASSGGPGVAMRFSPDAGVDAQVAVNGADVTVTTRAAGVTHTDKIRFDTERPLQISLADYNFDGLQDFAIHHIDDGMGTYSIYRIFVYRPATRRFDELRATCGDEFINVVREGKRRTLRSSVFKNNRMVACTRAF